ncbi:hypothetical protein GCM10027299_18270 [Larkinella ripae]
MRYNLADLSTSRRAGLNVTLADGKYCRHLYVRYVAAELDYSELSGYSYAWSRPESYYALSTVCVSLDAGHTGTSS